MKGILVISHGKLAEGILDSSKFFFGTQKQFEALCIYGEDNVNDFLELIKSKLRTLDTGDGVLIMCDILFGTPCNCAVHLLEEFKDDLEIISGVNLPMVLQALAERSTSTIDLPFLCQQGIDGIKNVKTLLANDIDDE